MVFGPVYFGVRRAHKGRLSSNPGCDNAVVRFAAALDRWICFLVVFGRMMLFVFPRQLKGRDALKKASPWWSGSIGDEPAQCGSVGFRLVGCHPHFLFALLTPLTRGLLQPMFSTSPRNAGLFGGRFGYHSFVQAYGNIVRSVANFRCFDQPLPGRRCRFQETVPHGHFTVSGFPFLGFFSSSLRQEEHTNSPCRSLNASTTGRKSSFSMFSQLL